MIQLILPFLLQVLNPKNILIFLGALFVAWLIWSGIKFEKNYVHIQEQNASLQQNLIVSQNALKQEQQVALTQQAIAQTTIDAVEQKNQQDVEQISILDSDNNALQLLRKPTSEDNKCVTSPYVSTILDRLRRTAAADNNIVSSSTGYAYTTIGVDNTTTSTKSSP